MAVNYAQQVGIESIPAAVLFAFAYVPLFLLNLWRVVKSRTYVLFVLTLFCALRVVAFSLRAALASIKADAENLNLLVAQETVYNVGFFGLLYSAYAIVIDRQKINGVYTARSIVARITGNLQLIRLALLAAVVLGVSAGVEQGITGNPSKQSLGKGLKIVSTVIFFVISLFLFVQTCVGLKNENQVTEPEKGYSGGVGHNHGMLFLLCIALLLVVKEAFLTFTLGNPKLQDNEWLFTRSPPGRSLLLC
ncbi:hypothetical protein B0H21DRAFT_712578 [Amylocystis lapponica]|nr:hypothetical protein B0H21DRAFT_712578 [Amylocystis lapponica]